MLFVYGFFAGVVATLVFIWVASRVLGKALASAHARLELPEGGTHFIGSSRKNVEQMSDIGIP